MNIVSPAYFDLLAIPLVQGRPFDARDRLGSPPVGIVNETFARQAFRGQSAVGQVLVMANGTRSVEIVGVVRDVKSAGLNVPVPDEAYFPAAQLARPAMTVIAKTTRDPATLQAASFFTTLDNVVSATLTTVWRRHRAPRGSIRWLRFAQTEKCCRPRPDGVGRPGSRRLAATQPPMSLPSGTRPGSAAPARRGTASERGATTR
jgi:hypothetical protein